jgi:hypothetical protein
VVEVCGPITVTRVLWDTFHDPGFWMLEGLIVVVGIVGTTFAWWQARHKC